MRQRAVSQEGLKGGQGSGSHVLGTGEGEDLHRKGREEGIAESDQMNLARRRAAFRRFVIARENHDYEIDDGDHGNVGGMP